MEEAGWGEPSGASEGICQREERSLEVEGGEMTAPSRKDLLNAVLALAEAGFVRFQTTEYDVDSLSIREISLPTCRVCGMGARCHYRECWYGEVLFRFSLLL